MQFGNAPQVRISWAYVRPHAPRDARLSGGEGVRIGVFSHQTRSQPRFPAPRLSQGSRAARGGCSVLQGPTCSPRQTARTQAG